MMTWRQKADSQPNLHIQEFSAKSVVVADAMFEAVDLSLFNKKANVKGNYV